MKERAIIFAGDMVRAILEGRKTQTRRVIRPQPSVWVRNSPFVSSGLEDWHGRELRCPYGQPGDQLWVRETWIPTTGGDRVADYRATAQGREYVAPWKSPLFMPRWASRITLGIVGVRVERVQAISEADAIAEGVGVACVCAYASMIGAYAKLWNAINARRGHSWKSNPWVWVVQFKRI